MLPCRKLKTSCPWGTAGWKFFLYWALIPKSARPPLGDGKATASFGILLLGVGWLYQPPPFTFPPGSATGTEGENSEVSLTAAPTVPGGTAVTVAVALASASVASAVGKVTLKAVFPVGSVVTWVEPMNCCPSRSYLRKRVPSGVEKNSIVNVLLAVLLREPEMVVLLPATTRTEVSVGRFCWSLEPGPWPVSGGSSGPSGLPA